MTHRDFEALFVAAKCASINKLGDFRIHSKEWTAFIGSGHFAFMPLEEELCCDKKRVELTAHVEGRPPSKDRSSRGNYDVIRIGHVEDGVTTSNFLDQKDKRGKLLTKAPHIRMLRSEQRRFARLVTPLIFQEIYNNNNLYEHIMTERKHAPSPATAALDAQTPPRPSKKMKLGIRLGESKVAHPTPSPSVSESVSLQ